MEKLYPKLTLFIHYVKAVNCIRAFVHACMRLNSILKLQLMCEREYLHINYIAFNENFIHSENRLYDVYRGYTSMQDLKFSMRMAMISL